MRYIKAIIFSACICFTLSSFAQSSDSLNNTSQLEFGFGMKKTVYYNISEPYREPYFGECAVVSYRDEFDDKKYYKMFYAKYSNKSFSYKTSIAIDWNTKTNELEFEEISQNKFIGEFEIGAYYNKSYKKFTAYSGLNIGCGYRLIKNENMYTYSDVYSYDQIFASLNFTEERKRSYYYISPVIGVSYSLGKIFSVFYESAFSGVYGKEEYSWDNGDFFSDKNETTMWNTDISFVSKFGIGVCF